MNKSEHPSILNRADFLAAKERGLSASKMLRDLADRENRSATHHDVATLHEKLVEIADAQKNTSFRPMTPYEFDLIMEHLSRIDDRTDTIYFGLKVAVWTFGLLGMVELIRKFFL